MQKQGKRIEMFEKLKVHIAKRQQNKRAISELHAMTDRDLADMGISRYDIERVVIGATR
jgi:uncharacterized protein YjiS (DUF1127 family)